MFQLLLESRAQRRPPVGGSVVATAGHAALVMGLVVFTAEKGRHAPTPPEPRVRLYVATPVVPPPPALPRAPSSAAVSRSASASMPAERTLPQIIDIPIGIPDRLPELDLNRPAGESMDFSRRRAIGTGGGADGLGSGAAGAAALAEDQVDRRVLLAPGARAPLYPESLRAAGLSGMVLVEFVVDTLGRVEPTSVRVVESDHPYFSDAVLRALPVYRFLPAEVQGRRVRQLVRLPFRFAVSPE